MIYVYVPETHLEAVKSAMFTAGGGTVGRYADCSWQVRGEGQFRPLPGSDPFIGRSGVLEHVDEYRLEMAVSDETAAAVCTALLSVHPYEEPAYGLVRVDTAATLDMKQESGNR